MLSAAVATGRPLVPVFVLDPETEALGAAALWRLGLSVAEFAGQLAGIGSRLVLRRGSALTVLRDLAVESGAAGVWWQRLYDPEAVARDTAVKAGLRAVGLGADSHSGHLLIEPWQVLTGQGGPYQVYTPFWRALRQRDMPGLLAAPRGLRPPAVWPASDRLDDWALGRRMQRGAAVARPWQYPGEAAAQQRLHGFLSDKLGRYAGERDLMARDAGSGLSQNLTYGEISPRALWHGGMQALEAGQSGAETFLREVAWREFAYHLIYHTPRIATVNWRDGWADFPWAGEGDAAEAWRRGCTGEPLVDAAMREMYVTGTMHNRARMIAGSYLTKHLLTDWRIGQAWFAECLTDWDPAANAMGWQWVAGCGPDAAPYFRVFNPETQATKFDADGTYRRRHLADGQRDPGPDALRFYDAIPRSWQMRPSIMPRKPLISLADGRIRALAAYAQRKT